MSLFRTALFGSCLALPLAAAGAAVAQQPEQGRVIHLPPGAVVLIMSPSGALQTLPPNARVVAAASASAMPMLQLIAQQQAAMQRMVAQMDALFPPMPDPLQMMQRMQAGLVPAALGNGHGVCAESVSMVVAGNGKPVVHVRRYGDACGAAAGAAPAPVAQPETAAPVPAQRGPKLYEVSYPPTVVPAAPPRT